jgi:ABC-type transport system substrate-binding protein
LALRLQKIIVCLALLAPLGLGTGAHAQKPDEPLRIAMNGFENNLTPFSVTFGAFPNTHDLIMMIYDSLFWSQVREEPEPWLAERAEPNAEFTEWTVTLRDGITWHDGRPLTAEDVKFSFEYYRTLEGASGRYATTSRSVELRVEALDPATLRQRRAAMPGKVPTYDAYISTLEAHAHVDPDSLYYFFHSPGPKGFGASISGYSNPEFDRLAEDGVGAPTSERKQLFAEMQRILAADAPAVVLWYRDGDWAYRPAAYDGWVPDPGQGIFTKRSFLPEYVERDGGGNAQAVASRDAVNGDSGLGAPVFGGLAAALAAVAVAGLLLARRRGTVGDDDDDHRCATSYARPCSTSRCCSLRSA